MLVSKLLKTETGAEMCMLLVLVTLVYFSTLQVECTVKICPDTTDPDLCIDAENDQYITLGSCTKHYCCNSDSSCKANSDSSYRQPCLYETDVALYQLYNLHISDDEKIAGWYYKYQSTNSIEDSLYPNTTVSVWLNFCGTPYLSLTNFNSASKYIGNHSIVSCTNSTKNAKHSTDYQHVCSGLFFFFFYNYPCTKENCNYKLHIIVDFIHINII